ncbi:hypothetical protein J6590_054513 [Homalodisca vitripennis]|nr:hypothetical protein J6590_054513 [Homalodisca vitripennis]
MSAESDSETFDRNRPYIYVAKMGTDGSATPPPSRRGRSSADNIVSHFACVKGEAKQSDEFGIDTGKGGIMGYPIVW